MSEGSEPKKSEWLISCDESGTDGAIYYGFGSLWLNYQRRGDFIKDFNNLREKHNYKSECKWSNASDKKAQAFILDIIEYFFKRRYLAFHCLIIRKGFVNKTFHQGDFDLARRKHFTMLLTNKMARRIRLYPEREHAFRIWVDPIASYYKKADEAVEIISSNVLGQQFENSPEIKVITKDSKETPSIQLCDLLLGAVMDGYQKRATNPKKLAFQKWIADHIGWKEIDGDTFNSERKFNIWYFHDPVVGGNREFETKFVKLKYPLPDL